MIREHASALRYTYIVCLVLCCPAEPAIRFHSPRYARIFIHFTGFNLWEYEDLRKETCVLLGFIFQVLAHIR